MICLGRQVNAIDGLEKRVKSRFGGRILQVGRPKTKEEFWKVCNTALSVEEHGAFTQVWNRHVEVSFLMSWLMIGIMEGRYDERDL